MRGGLPRASAGRCVSVVFVVVLLLLVAVHGGGGSTVPKAHNPPRGPRRCIHHVHGIIMIEWLHIQHSGFSNSSNTRTVARQEPNRRGAARARAAASRRCHAPRARTMLTRGCSQHVSRTAFTPSKQLVTATAWVQDEDSSLASEENAPECSRKQHKSRSSDGDRARHRNEDGSSASDEDALQRSRKQQHKSRSGDGDRGLHRSAPSANVGGPSAGGTGKRKRSRKHSSKALGHRSNSKKNPEGGDETVSRKQKRQGPEGGEKTVSRPQKRQVPQPHMHHHRRHEQS